MRAVLASALALLVACTDRPLGDTDGSSDGAGTVGLTDVTGTTSGPADPPTTGAPAVADDLSPDLEPYSLEVADFDGDGRHDLLVLGLDDADTIAGWFAHGHGDGTFDADLAPALKGASAYPAIGQLDGVGGVDVMVGQPGDAARIYRWKVAEFAAYRTLQSPPTPRTHVVADLDSDGRNDVVALCQGDQQFGLTVHRGSDADDWIATTTALGSVDDFTPGGLLLGRLDGDDVPDALLFEAGAPRGFLRVLGRATGEFVEPVFQASNLRPFVAALGDLDEDGRLDILAAEHFPVRLSLATGDGAGGFSHTGSIAVDDPFTPHDLDLDDLDGDGHLDIVAVDAVSPLLLYWLGRGDGDFAPAQALQLPSGAVRVHAAALDAGPRLDLAVATFDAGVITILLDPVAP